MDYDRLRELQEKFEENPRRYFAPLANEYRKGGQPKRAIEICRTQLAQMPGHMSGLIVFGQALYEASEFTEARDVFERALALDPENLIALRSLGDMSLQSGDTKQARAWYTRLLDADPKDTAVIALVSEIDESADAAPVAVPEGVAIDSDVGDQAIPFITDATGAPIEPELQPPLPPPASPAPEREKPAAPAALENAAPPVPARAPEVSPTPDVAPTPEAAPPPLGLERHYPVEPVEAPTPAPVASQVAAPEPKAAQPAASEPKLAEPAVTEKVQPTAPTPASFEDEIPLGTEGLKSIIPPDMRGAESLRSLLKPTPTTGTEGLSGRARPGGPTGAEGLSGKARSAPTGTEGLKGKAVASPLEGAKPKRTDEDAARADEEALEAWTPPPGATVHERGATPKEAIVTSQSPEPFVNETMAQLYLQQGYRQLALKVYYQLAEARPNDEGLKKRIAEIEAADRAAHPDTVEARREPAPVEARRETAPVEPRREPPPVQARRETPPVEPQREPPPVEAPREPAPVERPSEPVETPPSRPSRERESIESPAREEPRAEPEGIAARQPSIKEFFATLGRRRPPRQATPAPTASMRPSQSAPAEPLPPPPAATAPTASLDAVFAGATVNPADSRAAARLAGAFSGATGATTRTPPTPPTPTPRVNPRLPQAQESEEDVAKFRAWLDGLTGE